ncbi:hypothetical protein FOL47_004636, partial [Perkinsus chesapeaki]
GKLVKVEHPVENQYRSNFYGIKGRKRFRAVTPLIQFNTVMRFIQRLFPVHNPQRRMSTVAHRLRTAVSVSLLDICDAYMKTVVGGCLRKRLEIWWNGLVYSFWNLIYGSSIAPFILEYCVQYLEKRLPQPTAGLPYPASFMDDLVRPHKPGSVGEACEGTIALYAEHSFPLKVDHLIDDFKTVALGMTMTDKVVTYRVDKFIAVQQLSITRDVSYRRALKILGAIVK